MQELSGSLDGFGGELGGLEGADDICQQLAAKVGGGHKTWRAFLRVTKGPDGAAVHGVDRVGRAQSMRPRDATSDVRNDSASRSGPAGTYGARIRCPQPRQASSTPTRSPTSAAEAASRHSYRCCRPPTRGRATTFAVGDGRGVTALPCGVSLARPIATCRVQRPGHEDRTFYRTSPAPPDQSTPRSSCMASKGAARTTASPRHTFRSRHSPSALAKTSNSCAIGSTSQAWRTPARP